MIDSSPPKEVVSREHLIAGDVPFELLALDLVPPVEQLCSYAALLIYLADHAVVYSVKDPGNTCNERLSGPSSAHGLLPRV